MTADLSTLRSLKERLEKAEGPDRALDLAVCEAVGAEMNYSGDLVGLGSPFYTFSLDASLSLVREMLPGWWWKVGSCHVSDDACVCPYFFDPVHGARLREQFPNVEWNGPLDGGFDIDQRPPGRPAIALLRAMIEAMIFIKEREVVGHDK